jgi:hypothetical protein
VSRPRRVGVGAGDQDRRHAHDIGGQARGDELLHRFLGRHQHLAAHVAALLGRCQLVLEVHAGGTGLDHVLHQLEGVQHAAEARLGVGDDGLPASRWSRSPSAWCSWSVRSSALLMRSTIFGTESTGYSDWSGYISPSEVGVAPPPASRTGRWP